MVKNDTLHHWLTWIKGRHTKEIDLSLERVREIGKKMGLLQMTCPVITVGGTNGKGSCVAGLEAIYLASGYKVGAFTTPFLWNYNEQVRLQGSPVADAVLCDAFYHITEACGERVRLTVFEYGALATFMIFKHAKLDVWLLEVGLGGRWDAVNAIDADIALISSIGLDHMEWLGHTRDAIAYEKAGIFRANHPAICGDLDPPATLIHEANTLQAPLFCRGKEFGEKRDIASWVWWNQKTSYEHLPLPSLLLGNMSTALMAVDLMGSRLPVSRWAIDQALRTVRLPGRLQIVPGPYEEVFDVSHNPDSVMQLANYLSHYPVQGKTHAVFSMLADKDVKATLEVIKNYVDCWHVAEINSERATPLAGLIECFEAQNIGYSSYPTIKQAYEEAKKMLCARDRLIIFGSFRTVAETLMCSS